MEDFCPCDDPHCDLPKQPDPVAEFEKALEGMDAAMKRVIAAIIKMRAMREPLNAKHNW